MVFSTTRVVGDGKLESGLVCEHGFRDGRVQVFIIVRLL
jgi:hypothetical protein